MHALPASLDTHRVQHDATSSVSDGSVHWAPLKSFWFIGMVGTVLVAGPATASVSAIAVFVLSTGTVLLFGHSLGSHRKLIHDSFRCPRWLEYLLVWCGVQVGLAGPIGLLRQHELRDYAQRLPDCHDYLRHGRPFWQDAWWQLCCDLRLARPPQIAIEPRIANDRFYRVLERTWMLQQLPPALLLYAAGGWAFVIWGSCARVAAGVFGHWLIGWFAHNRGDMHHEVRGAAVQGRNIRWTSLLTMGESWHNNHHAYPGSARLGLYAGEWDPGWWMLLLLRRVGLVSNLRLPHHLAPRPELVACDTTASAPKAQTSSAPSSVRISSPFDVLSARTLQRIAGRDADIVATPSPAGTSATPRLVAHIGRERHEGLVALCHLVARRNTTARWLGHAALPLAGAIDRVNLRNEKRGVRNE